MQGRTGKVEDMLMERAERSRRRLEDMQKRREREEMPTAPQISEHSANLVRDGEVTERLYSMAHERPVSRSRSAPRPDRDQDTGQRLFSPSINPRSAAIVRARPIEEILHEKGAEKDHRTVQRAEIQAAVAKEDSAKPKVGPYSALLVQLLETRTQQRTQERLHAPIHQLRRQTAQEIIDERQSQYSFKPVINPISEQIDRTVNGPAEGGERLQLLMKRQETYEQRRSKMQAEVFLSLLQCLVANTFYPSGCCCRAVKVHILAARAALECSCGASQYSITGRAQRRMAATARTEARNGQAVQASP